MAIKQLSVFVVNRVSRINDVLLTLKKNNINVLSLSLADTSEYGLLRLIVDQPETGRSVLKEEGFSAMLTKVLGVKIPNAVGTLQAILAMLGEAGRNVEYMYVLSNRREFSAIVIKTDEPEKAAELLVKNGVELVKAEEVECIGA